MSPSGTSLLASAMALPEEDRAAIAEALWSSLCDEGAALDDEAFTNELIRRDEEMKDDPAAGISWSDLKKLR